MIRASLHALLLPIASLLVALPAQAFISHTSFETGIGAWQIFGDVMLEDTSVTQQFGAPAAQGDVHLFMSTLPNGTPDAGAPLGPQAPFSGTNALDVLSLETALGLQAGEITTLSPNGNPAMQGSGFTQDFTAAANSVLSFDWNFLTNELTPTATYTDYLFWGITAQGGDTFLQSGVLMDTSQGGALGASSAADFAQDTGYQAFSTLVPLAGDYRIVFGIVDVQDENYTSAALIDDIMVVPEASTGLLIFLALLGLAAAGRRPGSDIAG